MQNAGMAVNITIRNVPEGVRDALAKRAAFRGQSMQEYLLAELKLMAEKLPPAEWVARQREQKKRYGVNLTAGQIVASIKDGPD